MVQCSCEILTNCRGGSENYKCAITVSVYDGCLLLRTVSYSLVYLQVNMHYVLYNHTLFKHICLFRSCFAIHV